MDGKVDITEILQLLAKECDVQIIYRDGRPAALQITLKIRSDAAPLQEVG